MPNRCPASRAGCRECSRLSEPECYLVRMHWRASFPIRHHPRGLIEPCLPTPADAVVSGPVWVHEIKHDGYQFILPASC
jgi:hypothetical protein